MILKNLGMALTSLRHAKMRSFLTMLGIIIGVSSVVTVIAIGGGVKNEVSNQVSGFGANLIQVNPGKSVTTDEEGNSTGFNFAASLGASTLTEADVAKVKQIPGVTAAAPMMIISGVPTAGNQKAENAFVIATQPETITIVNRKVGEGRFLQDGDTKTVTLGSNIAKQLFPDGKPLGKTVLIRNTEFIVVGVMEPEKEGGLNFGPSFGDAIYLPFETGKALNGGVANIMEIDATAATPQAVGGVVSAIRQDLKTLHGGQEDFTVLTADDQLKIFESILNILTSFVAAIAAISLFVGGIGIMNIMLVSVTERTREIGVRKAIGASNRQILGQFLIEAVVLSLFGGLLGVLASFGLSIIVKATTDITPIFNANAFVIAVSVSTVVGVVFGMAPAIKAARKNPIEALRYE